MLCNGQLPLIGLVEKVERELAWKVCYGLPKNCYILTSRLLMSILTIVAHLLCRQSVLIFQQSQTLSDYFTHLRCTGITGVELQVIYTCIQCV